MKLDMEKESEHKKKKKGASKTMQETNENR
jgi:hypothetical protein